MLIERDGEVATLARILSAVLGGAAGRVALVCGPRSSGRTTLARHVAELARERDALVLVGGGSRAERDMPGSVLCQLTGGPELPEEPDTELLLAVDDLLADSTGTRPGADDAPRLDRTRAIRRVCRRLIALAATRPVVMVVDDFELIDELTASVLLYLHRRIQSSQIMVVLCAAESTSVELGAVHAELRTQDQITALRLGLLSHSNVRAVVAGMYGARHADTYAATYHDLTGGNPRLLRALLEDVRDPASPPEPAASYRAGVLAYLHRAQRDEVDVLRAIAVLGKDSTVERIERLLGDCSLVRAALDRLHRSGIVCGVTLRHREVVAAVLVDVPHGELSRIRCAVARVLHEEGHPSTLVALRLLQAGSRRDTWTVGALRDGAARFADEGRHDEAVDALELATAVVDRGDPVRAEMVAELAALRFRAAPASVLGLLPDLEEALTKGTLPRPHVVALLRYQLWHGREDSAAVTSARLADTGAGGGRHTVFGAAHPWMRIVHPGVTATTGRGHRISGAALGRMTELLARRSVSTRDDYELLLREADARSMPPESIGLTLKLIARLGYPERADRLCRAMVDEARGSGATGTAAVLTCVLAEIAVERARIGDAEVHAQEALGALSGANWGVAQASALATVLLARAGRLRTISADALLRVAPPTAAESTLHGLVHRRAVGYVHLLAGRPEAARSEFRRCGELARQWDLDLPVLIPWRTDTARADLVLGSHRRAAQLALEQDECVGGRLPSVRATSLRVQAVTQDLTQQVPMLSEAAELASGAGARLEQTLALTSLSAAYERMERPDLAWSTARQAMAVAGRGQADRLCWSRLPKGVQAEFGPRAVPSDEEPEPARETPPTWTGPRVVALGPRDTAAGGTPVSLLSEAEQRVALLASRGHSNRAISRHLYITVSTVEQHLTRAYRKLNVRSRVELAELDLGPDDDVVAASS